MDELERPMNVGETERWASGILGGMLTLAGLQRRGLSGLMLTAAGGILLYRGATGHCDVYEALELDSTRPDGLARPDGGLAGPGADVATPAYNEVDEASDESFPASDAPSWTPTSSIRAHPEE